MVLVFLEIRKNSHIPIVYLGRYNILIFVVNFIIQNDIRVIFSARITNCCHHPMYLVFKYSRQMRIGFTQLTIGPWVYNIFNVYWFILFISFPYIFEKILNFFSSNGNGSWKSSSEKGLIKEYINFIDYKYFFRFLRFFLLKTIRNVAHVFRKIIHETS